MMVRSIIAFNVAEPFSIEQKVRINVGLNIGRMIRQNIRRPPLAEPKFHSATADNANETNHHAFFTGLIRTDRL